MKRLFDIIFSLVGIVVLAPLFLLLAILIVLDSKGGVFFRGVRVGKHGKDFRIFKFRSMKPNCEGKGKWNVGDHDDRITRMGHFLRKSKLDELPQLFNVLLGDMSFVGPRPELRVYVDMYTEREMPILDMKPGITDWASITNFDQFIGFTQARDPDEYYLKHVRPIKLSLQLYYREHQSIYQDIRCICWTLFKVLTRSSKLPKDIEKVLENHG